MSEKKNTFFGGAAILAAGVVIVKIIGALYKIPLANILGDTANGYFNSAYSIFTVLFTISVTGIPVALSKMVSEANALGRINQRRKVFSVATRALFVVGFISALIMFFGAEFLTTTVMGNPGAHLATMVLSPALLFICCVSALRGYAQGQSIMAPTAISQIIEALSKLIIGLFLAKLLLDYGASLTDAFTPSELAVGGAIGGVTIGTMLALTFLALDRMRRNRNDRLVGTDTPESGKAILRRLFRLAIPIMLSCSVNPLVNFLDTVQVQTRLQSVFSLSPDTTSALYGTYAAAVTLYNLPSALMEPFSVSLVPAISAARARGEHDKATQVTESALRLAMLIACPMGFGLTCLSTPIVTMLYKQYDSSVMGPILAVLGITSICTAVVLLSNSIMNASGKVRIPLITMACGGAVKLLVNFILVGKIGIHGAPFGTLCCFVSLAIVDLFLLRRILPRAPRYSKVFIKPLLASGIMALAAWSSHGLLFRILESNTLATVGGIGIAVVVYAVLVIALRAISKDDLALMPKGEKIAKILRIQ